MCTTWGGMVLDFLIDFFRPSVLFALFSKTKVKV